MNYRQKLRVRDITQMEIAEKLECTQGFVSKFLNGLKTSEKLKDGIERIIEEHDRAEKATNKQPNNAQLHNVHKN